MRKLAFLAALALAGCVHERSKALGTLPEGALASSFRPTGPSGANPPRPLAATITPSSVAPTAPVPAPAPMVAAPSPQLFVAAASRPAHQAIAASASLEDVAREHFLSSPTTIVADSATVSIPARYAADARIEGVSVHDDSPGHRTAEGEARLAVRRLAVRAQRITLVVRSEPDADVQISARGSVSFRSDQPASAVEESGLRSLLLRNDGYTPLR